jgi:hypothetical protein
MNIQKGFTLVIIILVVVAVLGIGAGVFILASRDKNPSPLPPLLGENQGGEKVTEGLGFVYPDDYMLKVSEVPAGFQLEPMTDEARKLGFSSNPGPIVNRELYQHLYTNIDTSKVDRLYSAVYAKPENPQQELGIFAVQYKSAKDLDAEESKIHSSEDRVYIPKNHSFANHLWITPLERNPVHATLDT